MNPYDIFTTAEKDFFQLKWDDIEYDSETDIPAPSVKEAPIDYDQLEQEMIENDRICYDPHGSKKKMRDRISWLKQLKGEKR